MSNETQLACPNCGGVQFNWVVRQADRGIILKDEDGNIEKRFQESATVLGEDEDEDLWCESCDSEVPEDDLIEVGEHDELVQFKAHGAAVIGLETEFAVRAENEAPKTAAREALLKQYRALDEDELRDAMVDLDEYVKVED